MPDPVRPHQNDSHLFTADLCIRLEGFRSPAGNQAGLHHAGESVPVPGAFRDIGEGSGTAAVQLQRVGD
ncbi:hypothetical protein D3C73_1316480 [compost metagenome]